MSRVAKSPIIIPKNVFVNLNSNEILVKNVNGKMKLTIHRLVKIFKKSNILTFDVSEKCKEAWKQAGTSRSIVNSMIVGLTNGFTKKLKLVGVGYKASITNKNVMNISLGLSHNIIYKLPEGVSAEITSATDIKLKGFDKQLIGQTAANLRFYRLPEPYKGKGVRYYNEKINLKEAKKK
ncbi:50S ribosomal protein L6 [Buchnera aphidicola (Taiwanaphis decaspermi)]|uniref:50S ribosomal protein L6 n=1 Tax=Buchnera aphidicola TaxID=9 RepID=UPI0031B892A7